MVQIFLNVKTFLTSPFTLFDKVKDRVLFTAGMFLFCILFLWLFVPFNISEWIVYTSPIRELKISGLGLVGGLIIVISQYIQTLFFTGRKMKVYHCLEGFMFDVLFVTIPLSILYSVPANTYLTEFWQTFKLVFLLLTLWYLIGLTFLVVVQLKNEKDNILSAQLFNKPVASTEQVTIRDENGQLRFSLRPQDILFFESADNYVIVYFRKGQRVGKEMVRTSLKAIESEFSSYNCIRCHRSFIVNMQNISSIKKDGRSYEIAIQGTLFVIPISRSYVKAIKEILAT